ncbi:uncharacterized protein LOC141852982 [Brevipalpus obovatus]|uniref:uncharacterized protein LOC141852982 n=1 Tax=Brevipalpus obovatus TaxID=246614 RepID=UPI003D9E32FD
MSVEPNKILWSLSSRIGGYREHHKEKEGRYLETFDVKVEKQRHETAKLQQQIANSSNCNTGSKSKSTKSGPSGPGARSATKRAHPSSNNSNCSSNTGSNVTKIPNTADFHTNNVPVAVSVSIAAANYSELQDKKLNNKNMPKLPVPLTNIKSSLSPSMHAANHNIMVSASQSSSFPSPSHDFSNSSSCSNSADIKPVIDSSISTSLHLTASPVHTHMPSPTASFQHPIHQQTSQQQIHHLQPQQHPNFSSQGPPQDLFLSNSNFSSDGHEKLAMKELKGEDLHPLEVLDNFQYDGAYFNLSSEELVSGKSDLPFEEVDCVVSLFNDFGKINGCTYSQVSLSQMSYADSNVTNVRPPLQTLSPQRYHHQMNQNMNPNNTASQRALHSQQQQHQPSSLPHATHLQVMPNHHQNTTNTPSNLRPQTMKNIPPQQQQQQQQSLSYSTHDNHQNMMSDQSPMNNNRSPMQVVQSTQNYVPNNRPPNQPQQQPYINGHMNYIENSHNGRFVSSSPPYQHHQTMQQHPQQTSSPRMSQGFSHDSPQMNYQSEYQARPGWAR